MITETIDELIKKSGIDLTVEYVEIELLDGEKVTIRKDELEKLKEIGIPYLY